MIGYSRLTNARKVGSRAVKDYSSPRLILSLPLTIVSRVNRRFGNQDFGYGKIQSKDKLVTLTSTSLEASTVGISSEFIELLQVFDEVSQNGLWPEL